MNDGLTDKPHSGKNPRKTRTKYLTSQQLLIVYELIQIQFIAKFGYQHFLTTKQQQSIKVSQVLKKFQIPCKLLFKHKLSYSSKYKSTYTVHLNFLFTLTQVHIYHGPTRPRIFLQCFALDSRCSKAKHCRNFLGKTRYKILIENDKYF